MGPAGPTERYEPLPGLFGLPGHLFRKLSPVGRRIVVAVGVLLLCGGVAAAIVLVPRIVETKRENAAQERRDRAQALAAERARLIAEQRPRRGRLTVAGTGAQIAALESSITRDARGRLESGELKTPVERTDCRRTEHDGRRLLLGCTAVTSDVDPSAGAGGVLVGYPYVAAVVPESGRYAFCKVSGQPAEGLYTGRHPVELDPACGG